VKSKVARTAGDELLTHNTDVVMQTEGAGGVFMDRLTGTLSLTKQEIVFAPSDSGACIRRWPLDTVEDYVIQLKDVFEFRSGNDYFRFVFDGHSPMKWMFYLRYMRGFEEIEQRGYY
jgi:hypothetical protein